MKTVEEAERDMRLFIINTAELDAMKRKGLADAGGKSRGSKCGVAYCPHPARYRCGEFLYCENHKHPHGVPAHVFTVMR